MLATSPPEVGALLPTPVPILEMRSIDKRFPGVHALVDVSMDVLQGEVHALAGEQLGKVINEDFFAVGIDGNPPTLDLLAEGKSSATLGVDPYNMGVTTIETLEKIFAGEEVPPITLTPSVVVTPDNLDAYLAGELWTEPVAGAPELDNGEPTVPEE